MSIKKKLGIWGYGRFGKLLAEIFAPDFEIFFFDSNYNLFHNEKFLSLENLLKLDTVILAIPIHQLESALKTLPTNIKTKTFLDICSVKIYPAKLMKKYLPSSANLIATHPMFGPDSYPTPTKNTIMMYPLRTNENIFQYWSDLFSAKQINIKIMSPKEHDKECAFSQNITHLIGRILNELKLTETPIATLGYQSLLKIIEQTCHDSLSLFYDLNQYNPYSKQMIQELTQATNKITNLILLKQEEITHGQ